MVEQEVEEFLEHFGVKGQKWGVRNKKLSSPSKNKESKKKAILKSGGRIAIGTAISAGTLFAVAWLATKGPKKMADLIVPHPDKVFYDSKFQTNLRRSGINKL